ncbi:MAG: TonB-dependent receptor [Bacteroidales bacterium]|jgi:hemoglobin/transferrin/lactoferrin receptor protein|nr:TonB-dependent receptor [Bacteroidales bacterium]
MKISKILIAFLLLYSFKVNAQTFQLQGSVSDAESFMAVSNANIKLEKTNGAENKLIKTGVTNNKGEFIISDVARGEYLITISHIAYERYLMKVSVNANINNLNILLGKNNISLGTAIVTSLKQEKKIKNIPYPIELIDESDILKESGLSISNILQNKAGIALYSEGVWETSVNIRGLNQKRIVILVDGNRIETSSDLVASLSLIDVDDIERVEVIKGATSSLYGSGAIGGVVNITTKSGEYTPEYKFQGNVSTAYNSVNNQFKPKLSFNLSGKKFYTRISGSLREADNIETPEGKIDNSQFSDKNLSLVAGYKIADNHEVVLRYQKFWAKNVGIPGGSVFPGPAKATYTNAERNMLSFEYKISNISDNLNQLRFKYFNQNIIRNVELIPNTPSEYKLPQKITAQKVLPTGEHYTNGFQVESDWNFSKHKLIAGLDVWQRKLSTQREKFIQIDVLDVDSNIIATNELIRGETPIPESSFGSAGLFFQDEFKLINDKLKFLFGGRFDGIRIENEKCFDVDYLIMNGTRNDSPPNQRITFEAATKYNYSWSTNVGAIYSLSNNIDVSINGGRAFRSPSLEERYEYIDLGNSVRLGDPDLKPEEGYSFDLGFRVWKPKFNFRVDGFVNYMNNLIVEKLGEFIYTLNTGANEGTTDTIPALINSNVNEARLYGVDVDVSYNVYKNIVLHATASYVKGDDLSDDTDLPLIPPFNGRVGVRYNFTKYLNVDFVTSYAVDQYNIADGEESTQGYLKYDVFFNSKSIDLNYVNIQLFGGIENITDNEYTNHLSTNRGSISIEPGRNLFVKMKLLF